MKTFPALFLFLCCISLSAQTDTIKVNLSERHQIIDGFGAHQGNALVNQAWWQQLFFEDLGASIFRVDLTPRLVAPYSDLNYYSPWFMGGGVDHVFNLSDPDNPDGPEGNRVRTYTGPEDYSRLFGGLHAPIAVMGPNLKSNVTYFTYSPNGAIAAGLDHTQELGDFKLIGSVWSPLPWLKIASGDSWLDNWWPGPVSGSAWPFVWGGNFAGGKLDVSGIPLAVFDDSAVGGTGPTSALTQFARSVAAYVSGYQNYHGARFYAISIQNEVNFEEFYNSATYPLSSQYIAALKAVRAEFDKYNDLKDIKIMGPEDLLGSDAYGLWEYGGGANITHKNLQYLQKIAADSMASAALDFFCIHGYDNNGLSTAGATPTLWDWWANGWQSSPAPGIPANVKGFSDFNKRSWMTETSGENPSWLFPTTSYPNNGGWSVALRIHHALTAGQQSAWLYWAFIESDDAGNVSTQALSNQAAGATSPKYVAAKHYFKFIRPGAYRIGATKTGTSPLLASAYLHDANGTLTTVIINPTPTAKTAVLHIPGLSSSNLGYALFRSNDANYWQSSSLSLLNGVASLSVPAYGIVTLDGPGTVPVSAETPTDGAMIQLFQNQPNPAVSSTQIEFSLPQQEWVQLQLFDATGRLVKTLVEENKAAGLHQVTLSTNSLETGVYLYKLKASGFEATRKLVVLR